MNPPRKKMYHPVKRAIPSYNLTNRTKRTLWFSYWEKMKSDIHAAVQSQVLDGEIENRGVVFHLYDETSDEIRPIVQRQLIALTRESMTTHEVV